MTSQKKKGELTSENEVAEKKRRGGEIGVRAGMKAIIVSVIFMACKWPDGGKWA
jgi:hypothetical protein